MPESEVKYWVGHVRGPDFDKLRKLGFVVLYPILDDYVFLEERPENLHILKRQADLGVSFLKKKGSLSTVTKTELDLMKSKTVDEVIIGAEVLALSGICGGMTCTVIGADGDKLQVEAQGYKRKYTVWIDRMDVVVPGAPIPPSEDPEV